MAGTRILIAELDSVAQAERFRDDGPEEAITEITKMLRVGRLISKTVLVTDAMLLDGNYFMRIGPEGVLRVLGANDAGFPLTVTGPAPSLAEGLDYRRRKADFVWSLEGVEAGKPVPAEIERTWAAWLSLVDRDLIRYEQQRREDFSIPPAIERPAVLDLRDEAAQMLLAEIEPSLERSAVWKTIERSALDGAEQHELKRWWNGRYLRGIADNAGADWLSFEPADSVHLSEHSSDRPLSLPARLLDWAKDSTSATVGLAWDATPVQRARLRRRQSWSAVRDLAYVATQVASAPTRRSVLWDSVLKVVIAGTLIALAVPGLELETLDNPLTWIAFAGVLVTTIPFDSLSALIGLMQPDPRAVLILHRPKDVPDAR